MTRCCFQAGHWDSPLYPPPQWLDAPIWTESTLRNTPGMETTQGTNCVQKNRRCWPLMLGHHTGTRPLCRGAPGDRLPRPSRPEGPPGAVSWAGLLGWLQAEQRASNVGASSRSCFPYLPGDRGTCGYLRPRAGAPAQWKARSQSC